MALGRLVAVVVPVAVVGGVVLPLVAGGQWAPPAGIGLLLSGSSMEPTLCAGDIVVFRDGTSIETGDIVTVYTGTGSPAVITHRVVAVTDRGYITQGDNVSKTDYDWLGVVGEDEVIGEVFAVISTRRCGEGTTLERRAGPTRAGRSIPAP